MSATELGFDELYAIGQVDAFLEKAKKACESKLRGKRFAGMETEDVVQEVLIKVFRSMQKFDSDVAKASTFVHHVMDNMIKDCYRKAMSAKNLSVVNAYELTDVYLDEDEQGMNDSVALQLGEYDIGYETTEVVTDIMMHLGLNDREKEVFRLRSAGYEFTEIADLLGVSKARVSQLWKNIRMKYELV